MSDCRLLHMLLMCLFFVIVIAAEFQELGSTSKIKNVCYASCCLCILGQSVMGDCVCFECIGPGSLF